MKESLAALANWLMNQGSSGDIIISVNEQMYQEIANSLQETEATFKTVDSSANGIVLYCGGITYQILRVGTGV